MHTIKQRIDHTLKVFRRFQRQDIVIGLTAADWDELCANVMDDYMARRESRGLTRDVYDGVPIRHLDIGQVSFVAHDFGRHAERRFPVDVLEEIEMAPA